MCDKTVGTPADCGSDRDEIGLTSRGEAHERAEEDTQSHENSLKTDSASPHATLIYNSKQQDIEPPVTEITPHIQTTPVVPHFPDNVQEKTILQDELQEHMCEREALALNSTSVGDQKQMTLTEPQPDLLLNSVMPQKHHSLLTDKQEQTVSTAVQCSMLPSATSTVSTAVQCSMPLSATSKAVQCSMPLSAISTVSTAVQCSMPLSAISKCDVVRDESTQTAYCNVYRDTATQTTEIVQDGSNNLDKGLGTYGSTRDQCTSSRMATDCLQRELESVKNTVIWQALMLRLYEMH